MGTFQAEAMSVDALKTCMLVAMEEATPDYFDATIQLSDGRVVRGCLDRPNDQEGSVEISSIGFMPLGVVESMLNCETTELIVRNGVMVRWVVRHTPRYLSQLVINDDPVNFHQGYIKIIKDLFGDREITTENKWQIVLRLNDEINRRRIPDFGIAAAGLDVGWHLPGGSDAAAQVKFENRFADETHDICVLGAVLRRDIKFLAHLMAKIIEHTPS